MKRTKIILFALMSLCATALNAALPQDGETGYLYNPASGKFISHGVTNVSNSGAKVDNYGVPFEIINEGSSVKEFSDATYNYIRFKVTDYYNPTKSEGRFFRVETTGLDCSSKGYHKWAVTEVSEGNLVLRCIYQPSQIGYATQGYYVAIDENDYLVLVEGIENAAVWQFIDGATQKSIVANAANARVAAIATKAGVAATTLSEMESAAAALTPMDKTAKIANPTMFENTDGWTVNNIQGTAISNGSYRIQNAAGGQSMTTQTVTGLPAGLYKVTVQAFYRASVLSRCVTLGNNGYTFSNAYFKANDNEVLIKDWYAISNDAHTSPTSRGNIKDEFDEGEKYTNTVYTYVGTDGKLDLTIAVPSFSAGDYPNWICFNNVKLTYYYDPDNLDAFEGMLATAVANANAVSPLPTTALSDLQAEVATYDKSYSNPDEYQAATTAVEAITSKAQSVAAAYADFTTLKQNVEALSAQDVYTDNNGAASTLATAITDADATVENISLNEAVATIAEQKSLMWSAALTFMKGVTINEGQGFNLTWMIQDADFSDENFTDYWTQTLTSGDLASVKMGVMRYYDCSFDLSQTLPYNLPAGAYRMKVDGFERTNDPMDTAWSDYQAGNSEVTGVIYLNSSEKTVMNLFDVQSVTDASLAGEKPTGANFYVANNSEGSSKYLAAGLYPNTLIGELADDGPATIGYRCANSRAWTCVDNFQLEYIGAVPQVAVSVTAGELSPVYVPFTLNVSDEGVDELYAVGGVEEGHAKLYAVSTVEAGTPCVAKFSTASYSAPMETNIGNAKRFVLPWYDGLLKSDAANYTWSFATIDNTITPASSLAFDILDYSNMEFEVNLENLAARKYLANVTYAGSSDASKVESYNVAPPTRRDVPNAVMIPVPAFSTESATLTVNDGSETVATVTVAQGETAAYVYNLTPQKTYTYAVDDLTQGTFTTTGHLRMINAPSAYNIRDLGGWVTQDGHRTAYGRLYRGSTLNGYVTCSAADLQTLLGLGIGAEIDLRWKTDYDKDMGCGVSAFGFTLGEDYYFAAANDYQAANLSEAATQGRLKEEFNFILDHLRQDKAVYFHCAWGADRTGMLAFLLEGVLGLTIDQIYKDYELTSFSAAPGASNRLKSAFQDRIDVILALSGATLRDKFENYFLNTLGVSADDITYFRSVMLGNQLTIDADATDNADAIDTFDGQDGIDVTMQGYTLYKDGKWNTICLPFELTLAGSPLAGATARTLTDATIAGTTLNLTFGDATPKLEAGRPYLIKWDMPEGYEVYDGTNAATTSDIVNPVFTGVKIGKTRLDYENTDNSFKFIGVYDAQTFDAEDPGTLIMGGNNKLFYPNGSAPAIVRGGHAYFWYDTNALADGARLTAFNLRFSDSEVTSINEELRMENAEFAAAEGWYTLDGRKLNPNFKAHVKKGVYIKKGQKVVIK